MTVLLKSIAWAWLAALALFSAGGAMAYEEPRYAIVHKADGYELRKYHDRVAAQISNAGSANRAFRALFAYISGANGVVSPLVILFPIIPQNQGERQILYEGIFGCISDKLATPERFQVTDISSYPIRVV